MKPRLPLTLAAISGFVAVAAGAFGAHGAPTPEAKQLLETGGHYQLIHALAVFACAYVGGRGARAASWLFLVGAAVFAFSLYALALGAPRLTGAITPIGGLMLLAGWLTLAWAAASAKGGGQA